MDKFDIIVALILIVGYIISTFWQGKQIDSLKGSMESMKTQIDNYKSYAEIYDPEKTKKYVEIMDESAKHKALNLLLNKPEFSKLVDEAIKDNTPKLREMLYEQIGDEYLELFSLAHKTIMRYINDKDNLCLIFSELPKTRQKLIDVIKKESGISITIREDTPEADA